VSQLGEAVLSLPLLLLSQLVSELWLLGGVGIPSHSMVAGSGSGVLAQHTPCRLFPLKV
jgi:hypothetical protein